MIGALTARAEDYYPFLTFETTDGAKVSVSTSELTITVSGTTLTAGTQTFILSNLSKMYFSSSDETTTGISEITSETLDEATEIYDLQGIRILKNQIKQGAYIIKTNQGTFKLIVK